MTSKYFENKTKTAVKRLDDNNKLNAEVVVPLKYLSNFWKFLNLPLINCELFLFLKLIRSAIFALCYQDDTRNIKSGN